MACGGIAPVAGSSAWPPCPRTRERLAHRCMVIDGNKGAGRRDAFAVGLPGRATLCLTPDAKGSLRGHARRCGKLPRGSGTILPSGWNARPGPMTTTMTMTTTTGVVPKASATDVTNVDPRSRNIALGLGQADGWRQGPGDLPTSTRGSMDGWKNGPTRPRCRNLVRVRLTTGRQGIRRMNSSSAFPAGPPPPT